MKIQYTDEKIDNFGGLIYFKHFLQRISFETIARKVFSSRPSQAKYSFGDIFSSHTYTALAGGSFTEDIDHLKEMLPSGVYSNICSTTTFQKMVQRLSYAGDNFSITLDSGVAHEFCMHKPLNTLLTRLASKTLQSGDSGNIQFLDHDHSKIYTNKKDAKQCYKGAGYYVSCFSTGNIPVYLSSQSGNSTPKSELPRVLEYGLKHLQSYDLTDQYVFRADGACYSYEALNTITDYCQDFLVRSKKCERRVNMLEESGTRLEDSSGNVYHVYEYYDSIKSSGSNTSHEIPVRRILYKPVQKDPSDLFSSHRYHEVITSLDAKDYSPVEIIQMYNQRGRSERLFDELKNDFNLAQPPSSDLQYNSAYFILCAISCVLVKQFKQWIHKKTHGLIPQSIRLKQLRFRLISIPGKHVEHAREVAYKLYTQSTCLIKHLTNIQLC